MARPSTLILITDIVYAHIKEHYDCIFGRIGSDNQNLGDIAREISMRTDVRKCGKYAFRGTVQIIEYWLNRAENDTIRAGIERCRKCNRNHKPLIPKCMEMVFP